MSPARKKAPSKARARKQRTTPTRGERPEKQAAPAPRRNRPEAARKVAAAAKISGSRKSPEGKKTFRRANQSSTGKGATATPKRSAAGRSAPKGKRSAAGRSAPKGKWSAVGRSAPKSKRSAVGRSAAARKTGGDKSSGTPPPGKPPVGSPLPTWAAPAAEVAGAPAAGEKQLLRRLRRERLKLQRQLVSAVQEIGILRQYERRVTILEHDLAERDATIASLRERPAEDLQGRLL